MTFFVDLNFTRWKSFVQSPIVLASMAYNFFLNFTWTTLKAGK